MILFAKLPQLFWPISFYSTFCQNNFKTSLVVLPFFDSLDLATNVNTLVLMALYYVVTTKITLSISLQMLGKSLMPTWRISCLNRSLISLIYDTLEGHLQTRILLYTIGQQKMCPRSTDFSKDDFS